MITSHYKYNLTINIIQFYYNLLSAAELKILGSGAKNPNIKAKFQFHIKEYKKAEYFSGNIQIQAGIPNNWFIKLTSARTH